MTPVKRKLYPRTCSNEVAEFLAEHRHWLSVDEARREGRERWRELRKLLLNETVARRPAARRREVDEDRLGFGLEREETTP